LSQGSTFVISLNTEAKLMKQPVTQP
jgi:hypothetical protein